MKTKTWVRNEISSRLANNEPMPEWTIKDDVLCEAIDRLANISRKHEILLPHEQQVFEERLKS